MLLDSSFYIVTYFYLVYGVNSLYEEVEDASELALAASCQITLYIKLGGDAPGQFLLYCDIFLPCI
jgi:hypothetical protein